MENVSKSFDVNTLNVKEEDIKAAHIYALNEIKALQGVAGHIHNGGVTVRIANITGWRVDYVLPGHYVIDIILVTGGKQFIIRYVDVTLKVQETLPTIQTMLNLFQAKNRR